MADNNASNATPKRSPSILQADRHPSPNQPPEIPIHHGYRITVLPFHAKCRPFRFMQDHVGSDAWWWGQGSVVIVSLLLLLGVPRLLSISKTCRFISADCCWCSSRRTTSCLTCTNERRCVERQTPGAVRGKFLYLNLAEQRPMTSPWHTSSALNSDPSSVR